MRLFRDQAICGARAGPPVSQLGRSRVSNPPPGLCPYALNPSVFDMTWPPQRPVFAADKVALPENRRGPASPAGGGRRHAMGLCPLWARPHGTHASARARGARPAPRSPRATQGPLAITSGSRCVRCPPPSPTPHPQERRTHALSVRLSAEFQLRQTAGSPPRIRPRLR